MNSHVTSCFGERVPCPRQAVEDGQLQIVPHYYSKTWRNWLSNIRYWPVTFDSRSTCEPRGGQWRCVRLGCVCEATPLCWWMSSLLVNNVALFAPQWLVHLQAALVGSSDPRLPSAAPRRHTHTGGGWLWTWAWFKLWWTVTTLLYWSPTFSFFTWVSPFPATLFIKYIHNLTPPLPAASDIIIIHQ